MVPNKTKDALETLSQGLAQLYVKNLAIHTNGHCPNVKAYSANLDRKLTQQTQTPSAKT
jgi:hypothetical protein